MCSCVTTRNVDEMIVERSRIVPPMSVYRAAHCCSAAFAIVDTTHVRIIMRTRRDVNTERFRILKNLSQNVFFFFLFHSFRCSNTI